MKIIIFDFNRTLHDPDQDTLIDWTIEILESLSKKYPLFMLSKWDSVRRKKVTDLDLEKYFEEIYVVTEKNLDQIQVIKDKYPEWTQFYSVGDRIKKEIVLWNKMWLKTIRFQNWKFASEIPESEDERPWKIVTNLLDIESLI